MADPNNLPPLQGPAPVVDEDTGGLQQYDHLFGRNMVPRLPMSTQPALKCHEYLGILLQEGIESLTQVLWQDVMGDSASLVAPQVREAQLVDLQEALQAIHRPTLLAVMRGHINSQNDDPGIGLYLRQMMFSEHRLDFLVLMTFVRKLRFQPTPLQFEKVMKPLRDYVSPATLENVHDINTLDNARYPANGALSIEQTMNGARRYLAGGVDGQDTPAVLEFISKLEELLSSGDLTRPLTSIIGPAFEKANLPTINDAWTFEWLTRPNRLAMLINTVFTGLGMPEYGMCMSNICPITHQSLEHILPKAIRLLSGSFVTSGWGLDIEFSDSLGPSHGDARPYDELKRWMQIELPYFALNREQDRQNRVAK